jgi:archaetidylinositol phosphate synthase
LIIGKVLKFTLEVSAITKNLKPLWEQITFPFVQFLSKLNVNPNLITVLGLIFTSVSVPFLATGRFFLGGLFVLLGAVCDAIDGHLARTSKRVSKFGALLDSTLDRIADFLPLFGLALFFAEKLLWLAVVLLNILFWFLVSYVKARMEGLGVKKSIGGLFERTERLAVLIVALLGGFVEYGLVITLIGAFVTFLQRLYLGYVYLKES